MQFGAGAAALLLAQLVDHGRNHLMNIADDTVVRDLEDGGIGILIDGHDDLALVHTGEMLDGSRNADRDVGFGLHSFAGLAYLLRVRTPPCIHDRAGGTYS